ncbi:DUF4320 family protein [Clostridium sp. HBUAS56017]|uniref:DUF4320 family protein n=1 Tax=Clostridium sp. HBUAS56017 TaxID=2571128 RepID=UPI0011776719|nr:DUF4320 family protein [Clostridium sp. HBUAS56017]
MKKRKGEVQQFFVQMICIIFSFAILLYAIQILSITITYNNINQTARKYVLKMERNGYLEESDINDIKTKLESDGNISSNTVEVDCYSKDSSKSIMGNENKVLYGEDIAIKIKCTLKMKKINFLDFSLDTEESDEDVEVTKSSTARY